MICYKCGGLIGEPGTIYGWGGKWCPGHKEDKQTMPYIPWYPTEPKPCEHCFCQEQTIYPLGIGNTGTGKLHKVCCMCGARKLVNGGLL